MGRFQILSILTLFLCTAKAFPAEVLVLTWHPNSEPYLGGYRVYWGQASRDYTESVDVGNVTAFTLPVLKNNQTYYFAVTAYENTQKLESPFSEEVSYTTLPALSADFAGTPKSGNAPLVVVFNDASIGNITDWSWGFGDGSAAAGETAVKTYTDPGVYTVQLSVTGPDGSDTKVVADYITVYDDSNPTHAQSDERHLLESGGG